MNGNNMVKENIIYTTFQIEQHDPHKKPRWTQMLRKG
jgi:hypothetical protein